MGEGNIIHLAHHLLRFVYNVAYRHVCVIFISPRVAGNCQKQTAGIHHVINILYLKAQHLSMQPQNI